MRVRQTKWLLSYHSELHYISKLSAAVVCVNLIEWFAEKIKWSLFVA